MRQLLSTSARNSANGSARLSQFSSTALPLISTAPGPDRRVRVVAVGGDREAVGVAVEVDVVAAVAVLVDAVLERLAAPGKIAGLASLQSTAGAETVAVAVDAGLALGDDVDEVVVPPGRYPAPQDDPLGDAIAWTRSCRRPP